MSNEIIEWADMGKRNDWNMPKAPHWFWRLPGIRHVWVLWTAFQVELHYSIGGGSIGIPTGYDQWALWGMWRDLWPDEENPDAEA